MIINTTFCVEQPISDEFIEWAKNVYLETACRDCSMHNPLIMHILAPTKDNTINFAIQFRCDDNEHLVEWIDTYQPVLLDSAAKKWGQKALHFTTLMQEI